MDASTKFWYAAAIKLVKHSKNPRTDRGEFQRAPAERGPTPSASPPSKKVTGKVPDWSPPTMPIYLPSVSPSVNITAFSQGISKQAMKGKTHVY